MRVRLHLIDSSNTVETNYCNSIHIIGSRPPAEKRYSKKVRPLIILDTNALYGDRAFSRSDSVKLFELARMNSIRVVVPEIVLRELSRQWAERYSASLDSINKAIHKANAALTDVGQDSVSFSIPTQDESVFRFHARKELSSKNVEILDIPEISISSLVDRDLSARKPFTHGGKGFRDALIWETILDLTKSTSFTKEPIYFVTNNHTDFCEDKDGPLHEDLKQDLTNGINIEVLPDIKSLLLRPSIKPLVDELIVLKEEFSPERIENLLDIFFSDLHGQFVSSYLSEYLGEGMSALTINTSLDEPLFEEIYPDLETVRTEIFRTGEDNKLMIKLTVDTECTLQGYLYKSDYYAIEEDRHNISIYEDWNDHVYSAGETISITFTLSGQFGMDNTDQIELEVEEAV